MSPDTPVEITLDALAGSVIAGYVDTIVPVKNPGARTFLVRVLAASSEADDTLSITPGMSARGKLNIDTGRSGIAISRDAILRFPDGRMIVWVLDTSEELPIVRERIVGIGLEFNGAVEITSGLSDGDVIVVRGNEALQDGQAVIVLSGNR